MEKKIIMPRLGETMEEGTISKWLVKEGEQFNRGQIIAEIESDKAIVELPALDSGIIKKIEVSEKEVVKVGAIIAFFE
jgi:pyruvate dehydrogenase E2 component (dihydrolipoamide acetyltransferase)|tara:strand:+ start:5774 stop:6007 length:234 start_codon:yes stop_codon:yes gene_type:complete